MKEAQCVHPPPPPDNDGVISSNHCLFLPKVELKTKNSTKRQLCCRLVEFLVFNSIHYKISVPSNGRNRVNYKNKLGKVAYFKSLAPITIERLIQR